MILFTRCHRRRASEREDLRGAAGPDDRLWPSHQATEDLAIMRGIPGMVIVDPCDALEIEQAVPAIADHQGPVYMRLLRGKVPLVLDKYDYQFELGKGEAAGGRQRCADYLLRADDHARAGGG